ncbi:MAG: S8 family serine peptidase, partial [Actinobacteria bacterium]|nr:S8 family serine peptidase [Actinomycetota bacterium]
MCFSLSRGGGRSQMKSTARHFVCAPLVRNFALVGLAIVPLVLGAAPSGGAIVHQSGQRLLRLANAPNDPDYSGSQAAYLNTIGVPSAWDMTTGSESVVVAVLDSGIDATHPDLAGRVVAGRNVVKSSNDTTDDLGHGTNMAGIIGAVTNNALGVAGVAWAAKVMPVKVTSPTGAATDADVASGIRWAVDHGADVISISLSAPVEDHVLQQ